LEDSGRKQVTECSDSFGKDSVVFLYNPVRRRQTTPKNKSNGLKAVLCKQFIHAESVILEIQFVAKATEGLAWLMLVVNSG
jgi:hypothetical protein